MPLEFFYFDSLYALLGGHAIYYLGIYGYAADITNDNDRAARSETIIYDDIFPYWESGSLSPDKILTYPFISRIVLSSVKKMKRLVFLRKERNYF